MIHDSDDETETAAHSLHQSMCLGSRGWRHESWDEDFYPDDLPEDWQLSYYANEFSTVLIPADYWLADDIDLDDWCEDVPESFVFYLEYPGAESQAAFNKLCGRLGHQLGGVLVEASDDLPVGIPVYYRSELGRDRQIWQPGNAASSGVGMIKLAGADMKTCRAWLEQFDRACAGNLAALLVSDNDVDIKKLQELKTLIELMGM